MKSTKICQIILFGQEGSFRGSYSVPFLATCLGLTPATTSDNSHNRVRVCQVKVIVLSS